MATHVRLLAAVAAAVTLAGSLAGCARSQPSAGPTSQPPACQPDGAGATRTVTESDSGSTICLAVGQRLEVYLHGTLGDTWAPVTEDGPALSAAANGRGTLPVGVTGGFFIGSATGDARLTSSRPACPSSQASPCGAATFVVRVRVR
jgi:hypothetical protein